MSEMKEWRTSISLFWAHCRLRVFHQRTNLISKICLHAIHWAHPIKLRPFLCPAINKSASWKSSGPTEQQPFVSGAWAWVCFKKSDDGPYKIAVGITSSYALTGPCLQSGFLESFNSMCYFQHSLRSVTEKPQTFEFANFWCSSIIAQVLYKHPLSFLTCRGLISFSKMSSRV